MPNVPPSPVASRQSEASWRAAPRRRCAVLFSAALTLGLLGSANVAAATAPTPTAASGTLASLSGTSIEVQNPSSGQVTVTWTPTTTFRQTVTVPVSTLAVGDCVTALGVAPTSKSKKTTKSSTTSITATTVSISQPNSTGTCSDFGAAGGAFVIGGGGFAGAGGFAGRGFRGTGGSGASGSFRPPSGTLPKGATGRGAGAFGNVAFGKVTSLSGNVVTVVGTRPKFTAPPKGKASTKGKTKITPAKPKLVTTTSKVSYNASTTFNETMPASSGALAVGQCVTALGPASDTGAITAITISVRPAGANGCFTFTGGAGFGRPGAGGGTGTTT